MNAIERTLQGRRAERGQSIYHILLIIAAVALAVAVALPAYEYATLFRGPVAYVKPASLTTTAAPGPAVTLPAEKAPATTPAAPTTTTPAPGARLDAVDGPTVARSLDRSASTTHSTQR